MKRARRLGHGPADPELEASAFAERVMTAIEATPRPTPVRSFVAALRGWSWDDAIASLAVAWHLGTVRTWSVAPRVRARSMALVLAVASVLATGSLVAAAAVRVAAPNGSGDTHVVLPAAPGDGIADPWLEDPETDGRDQGIAPDADHQVTVDDVDTDANPPEGDRHVHDDGDADPGTHDGVATDDGSGGTSHDDDHAGTRTHEGGDAGDSSGSGDNAHDGTSSGGSDDGGTSDGGSHGTSDGDGGGSSGSDTGRDGGDGGD